MRDFLVHRNSIFHLFVGLIFCFKNVKEKNIYIDLLSRNNILTHLIKLIIKCSFDLRAGLFFFHKVSPNFIYYYTQNKTLKYLN